MLNLLFLCMFQFSCSHPVDPVETVDLVEIISITEEVPQHKVSFQNKCKESIWIGSVGGTGHTSLGNGGWKMEAGSSSSMTVPQGWSGRIWPRTNCSFNDKGHCPTEGVDCCSSGSCLESDNKTFGLECAYSGKPPTSLIEMTFDAPSGNGPYDTYDVSFVDGWSVPVSMNPNQGTFNIDPDKGLEAPWCKENGCLETLSCPEEYAVKDSPNSCWSPCQHAVNTNQPKEEQSRLCCACTMDPPPKGEKACTCPDACCEGGFGCTPYHTPSYSESMTCDPWSTDSNRGWDRMALTYIHSVKSSCPEVYSWQFDDKAATFQCRKTDGIVDYTIEFCP